MFEALSFAEITLQHVELLPARTVMSTIKTGGVSESSSKGGDGGTGGAGGQGRGGIGLNLVNLDLLGDQTNTAANGTGGAGGGAPGGAVGGKG